MRIVVAVKHVPDVQSDRSIEDGHIARGADDVLNELDENAVEAAVSLAEELGGSVVALAMGPDDAEDALRRALQMGADEAVHVLDDALAAADVPVTARVLAAAVKVIAEEAPVDLVVTGMGTMDGLTSMLPGALAEALGLPALTLAAEVACDGQSLTITRTIGGAREKLRAPLPALLSVTDQANEPRIPNFKSMMAAKKKPIQVLELADLELGPQDVTPSTAVIAAAARTAREAGIVVTDTGQSGAQLVAWLKERKLV